MPVRVGIIGAGGIAQDSKKRVEKKNWRVAWMGGRSLEYTDARIKEVDVVVLAIATTDTGEAARDYILRAVRLGVPVVTCEKLAIAFCWPELYAYRHLIGYNAACGGGSEPLPFIRKQGAAQKYGMFEMVLNASLNYLLSLIGSGVSVDEAIRRAQALHLLEPGSVDPLACINGELRDAVYKTCVAWNTEFAQTPEEFITPHDLGVPELSAEEFEVLVKNAGHSRHEVSFTNYKNGFGHQRFLAEFRKTVGAWHIKGGFRLFPKDPKYKWIPDGPANGVRILLGTQPNLLHVGVGAGYEATTRVMLNDAYRMLY